MRYSVVIPALFASSALSFPHLANLGSLQPRSELSTRQEGTTGSTLKPKHYTWSAPGPNDVRSPCPTLNTLANHGFLPHDGRNITLDMLTTAIKDGINFGADIAAVTFNGGLKANPAPNAKFIDLNMLHTHNIVEHDGSISRKDSALDPSNRFDPETFDAYLKYLNGSSELTIESAANARARHALDMSKLNPSFSLTASQVTVVLGESAMLLWLWNRATQGTLENPIANRAYFESFFRNEKLPVELGWAPVETEFNVAALTSLIGKLQAASPADVPLGFTPAASR